MFEPAQYVHARLCEFLPASAQWDAPVTYSEPFRLSVTRRSFLEDQHGPVRDLVGHTAFTV